MTFIKSFSSEDNIPHLTSDSCECGCAFERVGTINESGADACNQAGINAYALPSVISA